MPFYLSAPTVLSSWLLSTSHYPLYCQAGQLRWDLLLLLDPTASRCISVSLLRHLAKSGWSAVPDHWLVGGMHLLLDALYLWVQTSSHWPDCRTQTLVRDDTRAKAISHKQTVEEGCPLVSFLPWDRFGFGPFRKIDGYSHSILFSWLSPVENHLRSMPICCHASSWTGTGCRERAGKQSNFLLYSLADITRLDLFMKWWNDVKDNSMGSMDLSRGTGWFAWLKGEHGLSCQSPYQELATCTLAKQSVLIFLLFLQRLAKLVERS